MLVCQLNKLQFLQFQKSRADLQWGSTYIGMFTEKLSKKTIVLPSPI